MKENTYMDVFIVDERFSGALESVLEQSVSKLIKDVKEAGSALDEIVKLTVFLKTEDEGEISDMKVELAEMLKKEFGQNIPAFMILSQPSLSGNDILLEAIFVEKGAKIKIERNTFNKHSYVVLYSGKKSPRLIISGGITSPDDGDFVFECQRVLDLAEQLLLKEDLDFSHITNQSNYVPSLFSQSKYGNTNIENIRIFEKIRGLYFSTGMFKGKIMPQFTAVGTKAGNVTVDFTALSEGLPVDTGKSKKEEILLTGLYTAGKAVGDVKGKSVEEQARSMVTSIAGEISSNEIAYLRVYLKEKTDLATVKKVVGEHINAANIVYLEADMHDDDLRVFMEAVR